VRECHPIEKLISLWVRRSSRVIACQPCGGGPPGAGPLPQGVQVKSPHISITATRPWRILTRSGCGSFKAIAIRLAALTSQWGVFAGISTLAASWLPGVACVFP